MTDEINDINKPIKEVEGVNNKTEKSLPIMECTDDIYFAAGVTVGGRPYRRNGEEKLEKNIIHEAEPNRAKETHSDIKTDNTIDLSPVLSYPVLNVLGILAIQFIPVFGLLYLLVSSFATKSQIKKNLCRALLIYNLVIIIVITTAIYVISSFWPQSFQLVLEYINTIVHSLFDL